MGLSRAEGVGVLGSLLQGAWSALGRAGAIALLGLLAAALFAGPALEARVKEYQWYSLSPENSGDGGSSAFLSHLRREAPGRVVLGGPEEAVGAAREGYRVLYIVLGPDKPFTSVEILEIREAFSTGRLRLLVADDLGVARSLLEALDAPVPGRPAYNPGASGEWRYILTVECGPVKGTASEALIVEPRGGSTVCKYHEAGEPAAAWRGGPGWSGVLVVGDASVFSNFLFRGSMSWLGSSRSLALWLTYKAGLGEADLIVVDNVHYNARMYVYRGQYGALLLAGVSEALATALSGFALREPLAATLVMAGLATALAAIVTNPYRGLTAPRRALVAPEEAVVVEEVLDRLGGEYPAEGLKSLGPGEAASLIRAALRRYKSR